MPSKDLRKQERCLNLIFDYKDIQKIRRGAMMAVFEQYGSAEGTGGVHNRYSIDRADDRVPPLPMTR